MCLNYIPWCAIVHTLVCTKTHLAVLFNTPVLRVYRKPNDDPLYINKHSNHPPSILRQLPTSINKRISTLLSDKQTFEDAAPAYQNALGHSNFSHKLEYTPHGTQRPRRNRQRNVIWLNPPFSKNVKTNIARSFLHLVDTHFPASHKLQKIFNRNTVNGSVTVSIGTQLRSVTVV